MLMESVSNLMLLVESRVDSIFYLLLFFCIGCFVLSELTWAVFRFSKPKTVKVPRGHLDWLWSFIPALTLILLTLVKSR